MSRKILVVRNSDSPSVTNRSNTGDGCVVRREALKLALMLIRSSLDSVYGMGDADIARLHESEALLSIELADNDWRDQCWVTCKRCSDRVPSGTLYVTLSGEDANGCAFCNRRSILDIEWMRKRREGR